MLLLTDPVDAFWTSAPLDFGGKPLKSLSQGDVDFGLIPLIDDKAGEDKSGADEAATIAVIKDTLGDRVSDVRVSQRLTTSASCLVAGSTADRRWSDCWRSKIAVPSPSRSSRSICATRWSRRLPVRRDAADLSFLLLEQAQILDGELPEDPAAFANRLNQLVLRGYRRDRLDTEPVAACGTDFGIPQGIIRTQGQTGAYLFDDIDLKIPTSGSSMATADTILRRHSGLSRLCQPDGPGAVFAVAR